MFLRLEESITQKLMIIRNYYGLYKTGDESLVVQISPHFLQNIQYLNVLLIQTTLKELPMAAAGKTEQQVNTTDWTVTQSIQYIHRRPRIITPSTEHIHTNPY